MSLAVWINGLDARQALSARVPRVLSSSAEGTRGFGGAGAIDFEQDVATGSSAR